MHIPIFRSGTLLEIWQFQDVPLSQIAQPKDSSVLILPKVTEDIIAVNRTGSMAKP